MLHRLVSVVFGDRTDPAVRLTVLASLGAVALSVTAGGTGSAVPGAVFAGLWTITGIVAAGGRTGAAINGACATGFARVA